MDYSFTSTCLDHERLRLVQCPGYRFLDCKNDCRAFAIPLIMRSTPKYQSKVSCTPVWAIDRSHDN